MRRAILLSSLHLHRAGPTASRRIEDAVWVVMETSFILTVELPRQTDLQGWSDKLWGRFTVEFVTSQLHRHKLTMDWLTHAYAFMTQPFKWMIQSLEMKWLSILVLLLSNNFSWIVMSDAQVIRFQFSILWSQHWKHPGFCGNNVHLEIKLCACTVFKICLLSEPNSVALKNINHHISTATISKSFLSEFLLMGSFFFLPFSSD